MVGNLTGLKICGQQSGNAYSQEATAAFYSFNSHKTEQTVTVGMFRQSGNLWEGGGKITEFIENNSLLTEQKEENPIRVRKRLVQVRVFPQWKMTEAGWQDIAMWQG